LTVLFHRKDIFDSKVGKIVCLQ